MADYTYQDIEKTYKKLGVKKGKMVFIESDLACLGVYEEMGRRSIPEAHLRALRKLVTKSGTIVVSTASLSLCNTNIPFDLKKTPTERGMLSEYVRTRKDAVRSFHPFASFAAVGKEKCEVCKNVSRHSYGSHTPMARMVEKDTLFLSIGLHPRLTCSTLHEAEMNMGVPYRYVKEFIHPVIRGGRIRKEPFYAYVWYYKCKIKKNDKRSLWRKFESEYKVKKADIGRGKIYSYSMKNFYQFVIRLFKKDLYILLEEIPKVKPYRKKM